MSEQGLSVKVKSPKGATESAPSLATRLLGEGTEWDQISRVSEVVGQYARDLAEEQIAPRLFSELAEQWPEALKRARVTDKQLGERAALKLRAEFINEFLKELRNQLMQQ